MGVTALDTALAAFQSAAQVIPDLDEERYPRRLSSFITRTLGCDLWQKQRDVADSVDDNRYTSVASCHAAGKSYIAARIAIAFLHTRPHSVVITTAPTARQVQHVLWREINTAKLSAKYPLLGRCLTTRYEIAPDWYAMGFKAKAASKKDEAEGSFQGFHSENVLIIYDEAAGIPESVYDELDAAMTSEGSRMLLIGNPTSVSGTFRESFHRHRALYNTIKISAYDTPNFNPENIVVRPYLITPEWANRHITKRGKKSPYVQARVFANFPDIGVNKLVPLSWIEAAENRGYIYTGARGLVVGVDAARFGDDATSMCIRRGSLVTYMNSWHDASITFSADQVHKYIKEHNRQGLDVEDIRVDAIGLGAGLADILRDKYGYNVTDVSASMSSSDPDEWPNFRHEMWWQLRERFNIENPMISIKEHCGFEEETAAQLSDIEYSYKDARFTGAIIEPKEETKKRTGSSPDQAECMALAFCELPGPELVASRPRSAISSNSGWANAQTNRGNVKYRGAKISRTRRGW